MRIRSPSYTLVGGAGAASAFREAGMWPWMPKSRCNDLGRGGELGPPWDSVSLINKLLICTLCLRRLRTSQRLMGKCNSSDGMWTLEHRTSADAFRCLIERNQMSYHRCQNSVHSHFWSVQRKVCLPPAVTCTHMWPALNEASLRHTAMGGCRQLYVDMQNPDEWRYSRPCLASTWVLLDHAPARQRPLQQQPLAQRTAAGSSFCRSLGHNWLHMLVYI